MLARPELFATRLAGCRSEDLVARRACLRFSLEMVPEDAQALLELAITDGEPGIRVWAVQRAAALLPAAPAQAIAELALHDRSALVRRNALEVLVESISTAQLVALTERALLDEAAATRWQARPLRVRAGPFDFAAFYRAALARADTRKLTRAALLGLAESGVRDDVDLVGPYLDADAPSVRRVAMKALGQLERMEVVEPFFAALSDPQPGVSGEARRALAARIAHVQAERVLALLTSNSAPAHARAHAAALGHSLSKWDALRVAITALQPTNADTPAILDAARRAVTTWLERYNRTFVAPTSDQLAAIESGLRAARIDEHTRDALQELLLSSRRVWAR